MIRLLFIDDDPKAQQTLSLVMEEEYKVYSAYTGLSGIELVEEIGPTAMIFVPSIGGRSHVEIENTTWEHCEAGGNVLLHSMLQSANEK